MEGVELFAHFIPKASLTALASRGLSIPAKNGGSKAARLTGARTTPRQPENTRRLGRIMAKDIEEVSSSATKRGLNELKQNASTPRKRRETNETNELLADNDGDLEPIPKSTLGPILVKVNFSYVSGTANVLKSFRSHTSSFYLKSPVALVRSIVAKSVVHSINASSSSFLQTPPGIRYIRQYKSGGGCGTAAGLQAPPPRLCSRTPDP